MKQEKFNKVKLETEKRRQKMLDKVYQLLDDGVLVHDPNRVEIRSKLSYGVSVEIDVNVIFAGNVILGDGVIIGANCILKDSEIGNNTVIKAFSLIENTRIADNCVIGPYARIRPGSSIGENVQIGNFVEIKNSNISAKSRINHLSFVGDADLADSVTIGAGTITCNHDGVKVNRTEIGKGSYIGSGCQLIAPLKIDSNATVGAGSTITQDIFKDTLTISRAKQVTVEKWKRFKLPKDSEK